MGINLSVLVDEKAVRVIAPRVMGLGDIQRKHLSRAEKLISVGLMDYGIIELNQVKIEEDKQLDFIFYLSKLYHRAGDFQKISSFILANRERESIIPSFTRSERYSFSEGLSYRG